MGPDPAAGAGAIATLKEWSDLPIWVLLCAAAASPQHDHSQMPGMTHGMAHEAAMDSTTMMLMNEVSGTSRNPESWAMPMVMRKFGAWQAMFMGSVFVADTQQSGPRGGDKLYSPNWFMASAARRAGKGSVMTELMLSLDPATVTGRSYPLLFQTGETAYGRPLVDAQHPHDFIMSLGFHYARPIAEKTTLQVYLAPVGDPALGPVAFPHRASAMELPQATLGHHWQDSTHIANEVVTVGIAHKMVRLEASGFYGAEPNENRWNIDSGPINSWSTRFSVTPNRNWIAQVSVGRLAHPEKEEPGDVVRWTASVEYVRNGWASSAIWGRNHNTVSRRDTNSFTLESLAPFRKKNFLTGRIEVVDKDELFHERTGPEDTFRIAAYTIGYTRDVDLVSYLETGAGANFSAYTIPDALHAFYGGRPFGVTVYLRVRLRSAHAGH